MGSASVGGAGSATLPQPGAREPAVMRYTEATVTTSSSRDGSRKKTRGSTSRGASSGRGSRKAAVRPRRPVVEASPSEPVVPIVAQVVDEPEPFPLPISAVESTFAARVPPPEPERPRPPGRRAIFLDVENTSRAQHLAHVIDHLGVNPWDRRTELVAVANWRVVGHEAARLLAARGAHLVHSAPSTGVRDWSDLRIAVAAGIWLASARPGDVIEIVSDDRAFDAVGDVAASLGIEFRRLSYRRLKEDSPETVLVEEESRPLATSASASGSRRRRRRRGRGPGGPPPAPAAERRHDSRADSREGSRHGAPGHPRGGRTGGGRGRPAGSHAARPQPDPPHTTAPHDELVSVVRGLVEAAPKRSVSIDSVANALKSRGFQRSPGSPRLVTRLRRIKELLVSPSGTITLAEDGAPPASEPQVESTPQAESAAQIVATPTAEAAEIEDVDDDRQPDFLSWPDSEPEQPEVDGNRASPAPRPSGPPARRPPAAAPAAGAGGRASRLRGPLPPDPGRAARRHDGTAARPVTLLRAGPTQSRP